MPSATLVASRVDEETRVSQEPIAYDCDPEFIRSLLRGLNDRKEGRMYPWSEVKAEFGIR